MGSAKHEKSFVTFDQSYEQNVVGLKGIIYFGIGLFLLIAITFALMWALLGVLEENAKETKSQTNPLAMSEKEALPPEPRLQAAPGFKVEGDGGPINLELTAPQSEYLELRKQWEETWRSGHKDPKTGMVVSMPIDKAKDLLLQRPVKAKAGPEAEKAVKDSLTYVSDASSGRMASVKVR